MGKQRTENYFPDWEKMYHSEELALYTKHWIGDSKDLMDWCWKLDINLAWVNAQFEENRQTEVCKKIIIKCRDYLRTADWLCLTEEDREMLVACKGFAQRVLFKYLTADMSTYCMDD